MSVETTDKRRRCTARCYAARALIDEIDPEKQPLDSETTAILAERAKRELRKRARGVRAGIPKAALLERSRALVARLKELPTVASARTVALFHPIEEKREVDLRELDVELRARGVSVCYPSFDAERNMSFKDPGSLEQLIDRGNGFLEPEESLPAAASLDVIVVPALLVDPRGYRLGYGGGFYDRTLPLYCPPALAVCVVYDFQLAAELPTSARDVKVGLVVTDRRVLPVE